MDRMIASGAGLFVSALLAASPNAFADCTLYDLAGLRGEARSLSGGERLGNLGARWNNRTSAAEVTDNCRLTLYADPYFKGESKIINAASSHLGSLWDNQASSAMCTCPELPRSEWRNRHAGRHDGHRPVSPPPQQVCRLYRDVDFQGGELALNANNSYSILGYGMNDQTSSVKVPQGCSLTVYSHENLAGRSKAFVEGDYNFVGERWNDRISSVECSCHQGTVSSSRW